MLATRIRSTRGLRPFGSFALRAGAYRFVAIVLAASWALAGPLPGQEWFVDHGDMTPYREVRQHCQPNCRPCQPLLTAAADALFLKRTGLDQYDIVFGASPGTPAMNTRDLDLDMAALGRLELFWTSDIQSRWEWQLSLMGFPGDYDKRAALTDAAGAAFLFFNAVPATPSDSYTVDYQSELRGGEINVRWRPKPWLRFLGGLRYLDVQEELNFIVTSTLTTPPLTGVFTGTDNDLYGGQIGVEMVLSSYGWAQIVMGAKGGLYWNDHDVRGEAADPNNGAPITLLAKDDGTSFVGEFGAALHIDVGASCALRLGCQILWVTDVALAPDQGDNFDLVANTGTFDYDAPVYMGGFAGFQWTF